jgi:hypothetical protein
MPGAAAERTGADAAAAVHRIGLGDQVRFPLIRS